jgi:catechol 2,3-dioxygenase-like lactoylglutathione lyase family enzyme
MRTRGGRDKPARDLARAAEARHRGGIMPAAEVIGIDHVYLTVSSLARSEAFYDRVLQGALGFRKNAFTLDGDAHVQYYNRHLGIVLRPARRRAAHDRYAPGLHHLCLRVADEADVDRVAKALAEAGLGATPPKAYPEYAPDYRATFVDDPDGLRLEITNFRAERRERMERWDASEVR